MSSHNLRTTLSKMAEDMTTPATTDAPGTPPATFDDWITPITKVAPLPSDPAVKDHRYRLPGYQRNPTAPGSAFVDHVVNALAGDPTHLFDIQSLTTDEYVSALIELKKILHQTKEAEIEYARKNT